VVVKQRKSRTTTKVTSIGDCLPTCPSTRFEDEANATGATVIAGIDEAGRGPLAGPVVAGAVVLRTPDCIPELNDSKLLDACTRDGLFKKIHERSVAIGIGVVSSTDIDRLNIYQATRVAMKIAVSKLNPVPDYLLIDGNLRLDVTMPQRAIIKGDRLSFSIAAAGILAKVFRDRLMLEIHEQYPVYGFDKHKGYATQVHREALRKYGPCPIHRTGFKGVKEFFECAQTSIFGVNPSGMGEPLAGK
jgi:ribonuclease HII